MSDLVSEILGSLDSQKIQEIASSLGLNPDQAKTAVGMAVPFLVGALNKNASTPDGAQALHQALVKDHDGGLLDNITGALMGQVAGRAGNGQAILGHILGGEQQAVGQKLGGVAGLDSSKALQLLSTLAPLVMSALGKLRMQKQLDSSDLQAELQKQQAKVEATDPGLMGMLTGVLDKDKDGSALDDVMGMAMNYFKR